MASLTTLNPTTELEAVNAMLATIGQSPVSAVEGNTAVDVVMAVNTLKTAQRETLSRRWRFNTEYGYEVEPSDTYTWTDGTNLNIYKVPDGLASFELTKSPDQTDIDAVSRPSRKWIDPVTLDTALVFYDRLRSRDGFPVAERSVLKINPVWILDFQYCPEAARRYITLVAARRFQSQITKSEVLDKVSQEEETAALQALLASERIPAAPSVDGGDQTETNAVNHILGSVGLPPVISTDSIETPEGIQALNLLRQSVREICAEGWRFNTEYGYEVLPGDTFEWTNGFGETYTLNVFLVPDGLLSFDINSARWQQGDNYLDLTARLSRDYTDVDGNPVMIFGDRATNSDGLYGREAIYIDPVWMAEFSGLPEEAKHYALVLSSRRFAGDKASYDRRDEIMAYRALKRAHGKTDNYNIFNNASTRSILGRRPGRPNGAVDWRATGG